MPKGTRLDDSADIYQRRDDKATDKQKLKDMTREEKIQYFNDYYKNKLIIAILAGAFIIYLLYDALKPHAETVLYAAILNDSISLEAEAQLTAGFSDYLKLDPKKESVFVDTTMFISTTETTQSTMVSEQKLITFLSAGTVDVIIADEETFHRYSNKGYFHNMADQLPTDLYSRLADSFYMDTPEKTTEEKTFGIRLNNCKKYKQLGSTVKNPVLGIPVNSRYTQNAVEFIKYLFEQ